MRPGSAGGWVGFGREAHDRRVVQVMPLVRALGAFCGRRPGGAGGVVSANSLSLTGGGGGGTSIDSGYSPASTSGSGGSGIVVIRYFAN